MTYEEALHLAIQRKWKTSTCGQGEKCWCRIVEPEEPVYWGEDGIEQITISRSGELNQYFAEYFVELHNKTIEWY